jgi:tetratricopeptide (TPR) repeat protein
VNELLIGLLGALMATNQVTAISNVVARTTGIQLPVTDPADPVAREFRALMEKDEAAHDEVDAWIKQDMADQERGGVGSATLPLRLEQRLKPIQDAYEEFIRRHPRHVGARLAYGSFLNDQGKETEALEQWEKARELDPNNPAAWNNLADIYSHRGPVTKAFAYLEKAIELNPAQSVYHQNLGILVSIFRKDAREYYALADDQQVFRRALKLYRRARELNPTDYPLATDVAQLYYQLEPEPALDPAERQAAEEKLFAEAVAAWRFAEQIARADLEREGVYIHLARLCGKKGRFAEAREHLARVKHPQYEALTKRLARSLDEKERAAAVRRVEAANAAQQKE